MMGKLNLFLLWHEGQNQRPRQENAKIFLVTVRTADTSEPCMQITTLQIVIDDIRNHRPIKAVISWKSPVITGFELSKFRIKQLPEEWFLRVSGMIYLCLTDYFWPALLEALLRRYLRAHFIRLGIMMASIWFFHVYFVFFLLHRKQEFRLNRYLFRGAPGQRARSYRSGQGSRGFRVGHDIIAKGQGPILQRNLLNSSSLKWWGFCQ